MKHFEQAMTRNALYDKAKSDVVRHYQAQAKQAELQAKIDYAIRGLMIMQKNATDPYLYQSVTEIIEGLK